MSSWDDEPFALGFKFRCALSINRNEKYDILSFTLGNQFSRVISATSNNANDLESDIANMSKPRKKEKALNNLLITSEIGGMLDTKINFNYDKIYIFFYLDEEKYKNNLERRTFTFNGVKLTRTPGYPGIVLKTPKILRLKTPEIRIPLPAKLFTFEFTSMDSTPGPG